MKLHRIATVAMSLIAFPLYADELKVDVFTCTATFVSSKTPGAPPGWPRSEWTNCQTQESSEKRTSTINVCNITWNKRKFRIDVFQKSELEYSFTGKLFGESGGVHNIRISRVDGSFHDKVEYQDFTDDISGACERSKETINRKL